MQSSILAVSPKKVASESNLVLALSNIFKIDFLSVHTVESKRMFIAVEMFAILDKCLWVLCSRVSHGGTML